MLAGPAAGLVQAALGAAGPRSGPITRARSARTAPGWAPALLAGEDELPGTRVDDNASPPSTHRNPPDLRLPLCEVCLNKIAKRRVPVGHECDYSMTLEGRHDDNKTACWQCAAKKCKCARLPTYCYRGANMITALGCRAEALRNGPEANAAADAWYEAAAALVQAWADRRATEGRVQRTDGANADATAAAERQADLLQLRQHGDIQNPGRLAVLLPPTLRTTSDAAFTTMVVGLLDSIDEALVARFYRAVYYPRGLQEMGPNAKRPSRQ